MSSAAARPPRGPSEEVPTLLERELDTVCRRLTSIRSKLQHVPIQEHLTRTERKGLADALKRAEARLLELGDMIRHSDEHA